MTTISPNYLSPGAATSGARLDAIFKFLLPSSLAMILIIPYNLVKGTLDPEFRAPFIWVKRFTSQQHQRILHTLIQVN